MRNLSDNDAMALASAKSAEEFIVEKDVRGIHGKLNSSDSLYVVTVLVVRHRQDIADRLADLGMFTLDSAFARGNFANSIGGRQAYINDGMDKFILKHYN